MQVNPDSSKPVQGANESPAPTKKRKREESTLPIGIHGSGVKFAADHQQTLRPDISKLARVYVQPLSHTSTLRNRVSTQNT